MPEAPTQQIENSILHDLKQLIGQEWDDPTFDLDLKIHANSEFFELKQIGVGPAAGFQVNDATTLWTAFIPDNPTVLAAAKELIFIRTRLTFDPPTNGFLVTNLQEKANKLEWRLQVECDPPLETSLLGDINE